MIKILIVDDSRTARLLIRVHMPAAATVDLHEASDWISALEQGRALGPDLVILDYNMPEKNGVDIGRAMMAVGIAARYVLLTANTQRTVIEAAQAAGFAAIVSKPITTTKLTELLQDLAP